MMIPDPNRISGRGPLYYVQIMSMMRRDAIGSLLLGNEKNMFV